ncbi:hypothetical protein NC652_031020 [Populus alba x Populus x berolinensis]|nr:hypothetical protein NC652_031020 [Populus alba x Populus x berolinensis]
MKVLGGNDMSSPPAMLFFNICAKKSYKLITGCSSAHWSASFAKHKVSSIGQSRTSESRISLSASFSIASSSENLDSSNLRSSSILQQFSSVAYTHTILEPTGNLTSARRKHEFSVPSVLLSVEANGAGREAFLIVETFPFDTPYTVQKSDIANQSSELRRIYKILLVF